MVNFDNTVWVEVVPLILSDTMDVREEFRPASRSPVLSEFSIGWCRKQIFARGIKDFYHSIWR